ncbi:MAG: glycosyltransferase family 4 protein, partial [Polyangiaceae bacterium]|nr:glycosyltransferase family 4 protein [Polyangiaceae bacterium]
MAMAALGDRSSSPTERDTTGATRPRSYVFDDLFAKRYDEGILAGADGAGAPAGLMAPIAPAARLGARKLSRVVPRWARVAAEVQRRRDEYDVIVTWSERISLSLMALQWLSGKGKPHIPMLYWFSRPSVQIPMRAFASSLHAIITWSTVQRNYAIERLGIGHEKLYLVKHFVDQVFWSPREREADMICSAGAEMRDYPTLFEALRGTDLRCHVAADHVRVDRLGFARRLSIDTFATMAGGAKATIGRKRLVDLRDLYARSRFVVVPLQASDTDNGITVILEAMAMGKPVICSKTRGQVDVIQDGVTGLFVPVGDVKALRSAIVDLWHDPARAERMGRAARAWVEKHHTLEQFSQGVKAAVDASLEG